MLRPFDELDSAHRVERVLPVPGRRPFRFGNEAAPLVETDRFHFDLCSFG